MPLERVVALKPDLILATNLLGVDEVVDADSVAIELRVPAGLCRPLGRFPRAWPAELAQQVDSLVEQPGARP